MGRDSVVDPSQLDFSGDFHCQLRNLLQTVRLTRDEVDGLSKLFFDLQRQLQCIWRGCQVMPFGSIVTGLGIRSSDVDCYVETFDNIEYNQGDMVIAARNMLRKQPRLFRKLFAIITAKVPIVKMLHGPTGWSCDISFKSQSGVRNSKLIAFLLKMDERALPLAVLIKYWSKVHHLTGTNLLPNYALTMMTIFFMQNKNILPTVAILQMLTRSPFIVDDWNTAFSDNYQHQSDNSQGVYELLGEFFQFYSNFNFEDQIISPFTGTCFPRKLFVKPQDTPHEFDLYRKNIHEKSLTPLRLDTKVCIQDVFEHNRNCTVSVFPNLAMRLLSHIKIAAKLYVESNKNHFLKDILMSPRVPKRPQKKMPNSNKTNQPIPNSSKNKRVDLTEGRPKKDPPQAEKKDPPQINEQVPRNLKRTAEISLVDLYTRTQKIQNLKKRKPK